MDYRRHSQGISDKDWPVQRLRVAFALILFFFFEIFIGQKLPTPLAGLSLGLGVATFVSALTAIREWKLAAQVATIQDAVERRIR